MPTDTETKPVFADLSRDLFDAADDVGYRFEAEPGLSEELIQHISHTYGEPEWMLAHRLKCFDIFRTAKLPTWGPDLSGLNLGSIRYFARAEQGTGTRSWEDVPEKIKNTFERLGIPEAERRMLAGAGAQYDSEAVYHSLRHDLRERGVVFEDMSEALKTHEDLVHRHFMRCVPPTDHAFAALHGAVWSGGTFLYVPRGVHIDEPLQAYFRMNLRAGGQFEHTLIILENGASAHYIEWCSAPKYNESSLHAGLVEIFVGENASMRYSSVENWSIDTYNLNTKRALVEAGGRIEWTGGNLGSGTTMLYPCSILKGDRSSSSHVGIVFANEGQVADTGAKVIHIGRETTSRVLSKSLSKGGGLSVYRGLVNILPSATGAVSEVVCDALLLDRHSKNDTIPDIRVGTPTATVAHEATAGRIGTEEIFYLRSRWFSETEARSMIVSGFLAPVIRELPLEYAAEMNVLIGMEMEGSVG